MLEFPCRASPHGPIISRITRPSGECWHPETPVLDAVLQRAKSDGVDLVMVTGEVVYEGGGFTRVDRAAALRELHESLHELADDEVERRLLSKALLPHVRRFYTGYFDPDAHLPYYRPSSLV